MIVDIQRFSSIKKYWNEYWFSSVSSVGYAFFRIAFGFILLLFHAPRLPYIDALYTHRGFVFPMAQLNILHLPMPSFSVAVILNIMLITAITCFILGYRTKVVTAVILVLHLYLIWIERFSTKGYGDIMTIYLFLSLFAPMGSFLSIDFIRTSARKFIQGDRDAPRTASPRVSGTLQRVMLWQLALIYLCNLVSKFFIGGIGWFTGENVANIYGDADFFARPMASVFFASIAPLLPIIGFFMLGTLLFIGLGLLHRKDRYYAIAAGIAYHSVVLLTTTVPYVFSWLMFSLYIIAIDPDQWETWWNRLRAYVTKKRGQLFYDDTCLLCQRTVSYIRAADMMNHIDYIGVSSVNEDIIKRGDHIIRREDLLKEMHLFYGKETVFKGFLAYRALSRIIPFLWPFAPVLLIPGMRFAGEKVYARIASRRKNICDSCAHIGM